MPGSQLSRSVKSCEVAYSLLDVAAEGQVGSGRVGSSLSRVRACLDGDSVREDGRPEA